MIRCSIAFVLSAVVLVAQQPVLLTTGAAVIGAVTQSGTWTVQPGNTANTTAWKVDGSAVTQPVSGSVTAIPAPIATSGGALSRFHAATAAAANIKASAGNLYGFVLANGGTIPCYVQFFNNAGAPTAGTSVLDSYMVQAGVSISVPPGIFALTNYSTGIALAAATADGGATTTGCTTTMSVTVYYQ